MVVMIKVNQLKKSYGLITAVDGIDLDIKTGETFGLLGPNGAGKSTTINAIIGLVQPDHGTVRIGVDNQQDPYNPNARKIIGIAPQSLSLYEELTAIENLRFFGRLYKLKSSELKKRIEWALELAGLSDRRNGKVITYSGGMKRRLNIACALVHDPEIILLDEPTVGVDPQSRNHIFECIENLGKQGKTIIYTTHYMEEAQRLCSRVAIMDHGKILAMDTVDALINEYGGRSVIYAELKKLPDNPSDLPGKLAGQSLRFESSQPLEAVGKLSSEGIAFVKLHIDQPDLETVFLTLTGRSLRD